MAKVTALLEAEGRFFIHYPIAPPGKTGSALAETATQQLSFTAFYNLNTS